MERFVIMFIIGGVLHKSRPMDEVESADAIAAFKVNNPTRAVMRVQCGVAS